MAPFGQSLTFQSLYTGARSRPLLGHPLFQINDSTLRQLHMVLIFFLLRFFIPECRRATGIQSASYFRNTSSPEATLWCSWALASTEQLAVLTFGERVYG